MSGKNTSGRMKSVVWGDILHSSRPPSLLRRCNADVTTDTESEDSDQMNVLELLEKYLADSSIQKIPVQSMEIPLRYCL